MFKPFTERIALLAKKYPDRIQELESLLVDKVGIYIDYSNVINSQDNLGWRIDLRRLKQFLNSFDTICKVKFYNGTLEGDAVSEGLIEDAKRYGYEVITKPVKIMNIPINVASIPINSPDIIKNFIRSPLLRKLTIETIEFLNRKLLELNKQGIMYLEHRKCNFDVEIGSDMLVDVATSEVFTFILWSGDGDFADSLERLLNAKRKCIVFSTARRVARELNALRSKGLLIYDIHKIRNFICWKKEIDVKLEPLKSKKDSFPSPQA